MQNVVIGIFGYKGSGKTLMLVILAYAEHMQKKKILSNLHNLKFPSEIVDPKEIISLSEKLQGCTICIDEIHTIADSRKSHGAQNIQIANFFLQSRHRGVNVIYTDQYMGQVEKRIRDNTDIIIVARNLYQDTDGDGLNDYFEYTMLDLRGEKTKVVKIYGKPFFNLYSDAEIIDIYKHEEENGKKKKTKKK